MQQCALEKPRGRWVYVPAPDEVPVTFQIGMVGSDGVLLASDRLVTRFIPHRATSEIVKIVVREDLGLAYCCSGDDSFANRVRIILDAHLGKKAIPIESHLSEGIEVARRGGNLGQGSVLIAYLTPRKVYLYQLEMTQKPPDFACAVLDRWSIGDQTNAAVFFSEQYLPKSPPPPVASLVSLAAHTVLMAHARNPTGVGGLDITVCTMDGFYSLPEKELSALRQKSSALDSDIRSRLLTPTIPARSRCDR
jgi:hypothetical protein